LGIDLIIRATDYNRFQEKVRKGRVLDILLGMECRLSRPRKFLFLLYGGNGVVESGGAGVNSANIKIQNMIGYLSR